MSALRVILYTRPDCSMCDQAREDLRALEATYPHELVELDISADPALERRWGDSVPVVEVGPYTLRAPFGATDLRVTLGAALVRGERRPALTESRRARVIAMDRAVLFLARHWLATFNLALAVFVGLPFLAPVLMKVGATQPATWIYRAYSPLCHQLGYRSWFLFGEQAAYARAEAGLSGPTFAEASGISEDDVYAARAFVGDARLGYKVAWCERDTAIWGGLLLGGLMYVPLRRRLKPLPILVWVVLGVLPIALDGGSQLLAAFPVVSQFGRESTPLLRTLTGGAFGLMNVWMAYPYFEESMAEVVTALVPKLAAVRLEGQSRAGS